MIMPLWSGVKAIVCGLVAQFVSAVVQAQVPSTGMKTSWPAGTSYGRPYHTMTAPAASNKSGASTKATRGRMEWMRDAIASTMQSGRRSDQGVLHWARHRSRLSGCYNDGNDQRGTSFPHTAYSWGISGVRVV